MSSTTWPNRRIGGSSWVIAPERATLWGTGMQRSIFLGGGITDCPDWQETAAAMLDDYHSGWLIYSPRRAEYVAGESAGREQIEWEHDTLRLVQTILFWFPAGPVQPIALFELGAWCHDRDKKLAVGADPGYPRRFDVVEQLRLARPEQKVHRHLASVVVDAGVRAWGGR